MPFMSATSELERLSLRSSPAARKNSLTKSSSLIFIRSSRWIVMPARFVYSFSPGLMARCPASIHTSNLQSATTGRNGCSTELKPGRTAHSGGRAHAPLCCAFTFPRVHQRHNVIFFLLMFCSHTLPFDILAFFNKATYGGWGERRVPLTTNDDDGNKDDNTDHGNLTCFGRSASREQRSLKNTFFAP